MTAKRYETSGVQGAILFAETEAARFEAAFNVAVLPCVSPWGYERIERWNPRCLDPNRSFARARPETHTEESAAVLALLAALEEAHGGGKGPAMWRAHVDCHETTNTDATEFMPAR